MALVAQQVLVENASRSSQAVAIKLQHLLNRLRRHPTRRNLVQATIEQPAASS